MAVSKNGMAWNNYSKMNFLKPQGTPKSGFPWISAFCKGLGKIASEMRWMSNLFLGKKKCFTFYCTISSTFAFTFHYLLAEMANCLILWTPDRTRRYIHGDFKNIVLSRSLMHFFESWLPVYFAMQRKKGIMAPDRSKRYWILFNLQGLTTWLASAQWLMSPWETLELKIHWLPLIIIVEGV